MRSAHRSLVAFMAPLALAGCILPPRDAPARIPVLIGDGRYRNSVGGPEQAPRLRLPEREVVATLRKTAPGPFPRPAGPLEPLVRRSDGVPEPASPAHGLRPAIGSWCLQFGAFQDPGRAQARANVVRQWGFRPLIVPIQRGARRLHAVRAGEYDSKAAAATAGQIVVDREVIVVRWD